MKTTIGKCVALSRGSWGTTLVLMLTTCPAGVYPVRRAVADPQTVTTASQLIDQARQVQWGALKSAAITDCVGVGQISILGEPRGPLNFKLLIKGRDKVQRIVETPDGPMRQGSDSKRSWQSAGPFVAEAAGRVANLIESQTIRSQSRLFDYAAEGLQLSNLGSAVQDLSVQPTGARVVESQDKTGRRTRYYIDDASFLITRLEFDTGATTRSMLGSTEKPLVAAYVFSDYRDVGGVKMPFKVEVYQGLIKIEEMNFTSFQVNTGLTDDVFKP